jgi:hypothetical protein
MIRALRDDSRVVVEKRPCTRSTRFTLGASCLTADREHTRERVRFCTPERVNRKLTSPEESWRSRPAAGQMDRALLGVRLAATHRGSPTAKIQR